MSSARQPAIDTCNACGKLFPRRSMRLCAGCSLAEHNRFQLVRDYLDEFGGGSVTEIAQATGVSGADVRRFFEGGRLVAIQGAAGACTCSGTGDRCRACRSELTSSLKDLHDSMSREQSARAAAARADVENWSHLRRRRTGG